ncbi:hypothetical protein [Streptomyces telluris]|uniref:Uncharacterized protein n=1 Tax=Streptomyces telluris TaxID=2720021 RepID=A0A9X2LFU1_9ACTN|nr:hypothetical protein [Streptomyces telluris]MCQ8770556.1 hypothetical protein [Streptomyces telluris]NJP81459.1 hypothetical protein [Streptomyces telluris]
MFHRTAAVMALLLVFSGARSGLVAAIDRKRYEQWAAEWQAVEPLWSKPLPT